jgi:hypothetical protein
MTASVAALEEELPARPVRVASVPLSQSVSLAPLWSEYDEIAERLIQRFSLVCRLFWCSRAERGGVVVVTPLAFDDTRFPVVVEALKAALNFSSPEEMRDTDPDGHRLQFACENLRFSVDPFERELCQIKDAEQRLPEELRSISSLGYDHFAVLQQEMLYMVFVVIMRHLRDRYGVKLPRH